MVRIVTSSGGEDDFPDVVNGVATVGPGGTDVVVRIDVSREAFGVGKFDGTVLLDGGAFAPASMPVTATIKDHRWWWPSLAAIMGMLVGLGVTAYTARVALTDNPLTISASEITLRFVAYAGLSVAIGLVLLFAPVDQVSPWTTQYRDADFWKNDSPHITKLAASSFAVGTGSTIAGLIAKAADKPQREARGTARVPADDAAGPNGPT